jgi:ribonucleoside-diphosphate reductase beta chain
VTPSTDILVLKDPQRLYLDWEHAHWAAQDVDLTRDPADWAGLAEGERDLLYWVLSSLMVAEERISTQFCGLVLAQDDEEEGSYLTTQLVDEVRHMQFYARFQDEVIAPEETGRSSPSAAERPCITIGAHVARAREVLGDPFRKVFDEALVRAHDRLRADPGDREAKVDFVTIYHMLIEGTLGLTASHFLLDFLGERELLPGFVEGYGRIAADEQRHIAYGTWFLHEAVARDPAMGDVVRKRVRDLLPVVAESISPPSEGAWDVLGVEDGALAEFGLGALNRRLALIGAPLEAG